MGKIERAEVVIILNSLFLQHCPFDYLLKPCDMDVIELTVERALERRTLLRNGRHYRMELEKRNAEMARSKAELERLQAQLVHSEKMASLGQLAAGVAHELNNPAGFIYGNMDVLRQCAAGLERELVSKVVEIR